VDSHNAAYLAGLIDGEGSFGIYYNGLGTFAARLTIAMTKKKPLLWVKKVVGFGSFVLYKPKNKKHAFRWVYSVRSKQAVTVALLVLPYLRLKKPHAENLIRFQSGLKPYKRISRTEYRRRLKHIKIARILNKRGR